MWYIVPAMSHFLKRRAFFVSLAMLCLGSITAAPAQAASQDECSIWLCLPGGFPGGCSAAYSAMVSRVKDFKSPLPDFAECAVNPPQGSGSHMTYSFNPSAFVPQHQECTQWGGGDDGQCVAYQSIPAHYVEGTTCQIDNDGGGANPPFCTQTVQSIKVFVDGAQAGNTFRW